MLLQRIFFRGIRDRLDMRMWVCVCVECVCVCVCVCMHVCGCVGGGEEGGWLPVKSWSDSGMELEKLGEELDVIVLRVGLPANCRPYW